MNRPRMLAFALAASCLLQPGTQAQTVYRCGNSYSQTPCPGGTAIDTSDSRNKTQKTQTDAAIQRDMRAAEALEKSRLKQEATGSRATRKFAEVDDYLPPGNASAANNDRFDSAQKTRKPQYFTAKTANEPKKKTGSHQINKADSASPSGVSK